MSRFQESQSLNPNNVPVSLVPFIDLVDNYGPTDYEGEDSHRLFKRLIGNRNVLDQIATRLNEWRDAEAAAYQAWQDEPSENRERTRFDQFFLLLDSLDIRPIEQSVDPVVGAMALLEEAKSDSVNSSNKRRLALASLRYYGDFAKPALPLLTTALDDEDPTVVALAQAAIAEITSEFECHRLAIREMIASMGLNSPDLPPRDRVILLSKYRIVNETLSYLDAEQSYRDSKSMTVAASNGHIPRLAELLAKYPADTRDWDGHTPLEMAVESKQTDSVRLLLQHGADPNRSESDKNTVLHRAVAMRNNNEIVRLLIQHGANCVATDEDDKTPFDIAIERGHREYIAILETKGETNA